MSKMVSHDPYGHFKHKLWSKEGLGIKLSIWLLTTKTQESPQFPYVQVLCDISLKISWKGLQLCFRHHFNWRSASKVMGPPKSWESQLWEFQDSHLWVLRQNDILGAGLMGMHKVYYKGEGGGFPQVWAMVNLVSPSLPVAHPTTKSAPALY
jgi:hypothetical protein